jgi:hypothetical protein
MEDMGHHKVIHMKVMVMDIHMKVMDIHMATSLIGDL